MKSNNKVCAIIGNIHQFNDLGELVANRPLATLPFAGKYRLIDFQLSAATNAGISDIYSIFHANQIQSVFDHVGSGREWGLDSLLNHFFLSVYEEDAKGILPLDYGRRLLVFLKRSKSAQIVYVSSNIVANIDLSTIIQFHRTQEKKLTVGYKKYPSAKMDKLNTVVEVGPEALVAKAAPFNPETNTSELENMSLGLFVADTDWLINNLEEDIANGRTIVSAQAWLNQQLNIEETAAYEYTGFVANVHDVQSYYEANMSVLDRATFNALFFSRNKIYTKVKNEAPTYYAKGTEINNSQFASGSMIYGKVDNSIIGRNATISEKSSVKGSLLLPKVEIGEGATVEYAILDKQVVVKPGVTIRGSQDNPVVIKKGTVVEADIIA